VALAGGLWYWWAVRRFPVAGLVAAALAAVPGAAQAQPPPPATFEVSTVTARETDPDVRVPVKLAQPQDDVVRVEWSAGPPFMIGDALGLLEGRDYTGGKGTLEFAPGETRKEIVIALLDDGIHDGGGMLALTLGPGGPGGPWAIVDVRDDEASPPLSIADVTVPESAGAVTLRPARPWPSTFSMRYGWSTAAGTAALGADFIARTGEVGLNYMATAADEIEVPIEADIVDEPDETFEVRLAALPPASPWGGAMGLVGDGVATVTIVDDDPPSAPALTAAVLRGRVFLRPRGGRRTRLASDVALARGAVLDLRRGAARLRFAGGGATLAGGIVKVRDLGRLALAGGCRRAPRLSVVADPGLVVVGRRAATSARGGPARWAITDRCAGTRVAVRRGQVRVAGARGRSDALGAGRSRTYR
jgi:hypothetical protein